MKTSTESRQKMRETIARERRLEFNVGNHHILDLLDVVLDDLDELVGELARKPICVGNCQERDPKLDVDPVPGAEAARSEIPEA